MSLDFNALGPLVLQIVYSSEGEVSRSLTEPDIDFFLIFSKLVVMQFGLQMSKQISHSRAGSATLTSSAIHASTWATVCGSVTSA